MCGSRHTMQNKYTRKSSITEDILDRFFRRKKYTCNNPDKYRETFYVLVKKLNEMGYYINDHYRFPYPKNGLWFCGEWINEYDDKYLEILKQVDERKAKKIEREIKYQEAHERYLKGQEEKARVWREKDEEATKKHKKILQRIREKKARHIAAYELLEEIKDEKRIA
jgi:hypothetical protein